MILFDFICDLFEVDDIEDITDEMIEEMEQSFANNAVRRKKPRKVKYGNMGRVVTVGDDRRCKECMKWDGKIISKKKFKEIFPIHPHCRCKWVPNK